MDSPFTGVRLRASLLTMITAPPSGPDRRRFLSTAAATGAGLLILPSGHRLGAQAPSKKLNILLIGVWGRGLAHYDSLSEENVVALCDVNEKRFPDALKRFPNAKTYVDWRKCLDQKGLDAVVICTADHTHAFIANWALNRNLHVYCEKPLAITVEEARVGARQLAEEEGQARHAGRHAAPRESQLQPRAGTDSRRRDRRSAGRRSPGATARFAATATFRPRASRPRASTTTCGSARRPTIPTTPTTSRARRARTACSGTCSGTSARARSATWAATPWTCVWNAVDASLPTSAEAKRASSSTPDVTPVECESHFEHPANDWRGPIRVSWYQGGAMPESPKPHIDLKKIGHGAMFKGSKGFLIADFDSRIAAAIRRRRGPDLLQAAHQGDAAPAHRPLPEAVARSLQDPGKKTACDFEYSADMIEQMLLGPRGLSASARRSNTIPKTGKSPDTPEANTFMGKPYREGWSIDG